MAMFPTSACVLPLALAVAAPAFANPEFDSLKAEIVAQRQQLDIQQCRLLQLEDRLLALSRGMASAEQIPAPSSLALPPASSRPGEQSASSPAPKA